MFALISHPMCLLHEMGKHHPEQPARIKVIETAIYASRFHNQVMAITAPLATFSQLARVHDEEYIREVMALAPLNGLVAIDEDTQMNPFTLQAALYAAGSVVQAIELVLAGEVKIAFCNIRPPGHHATRDNAMGFCFFNNVAVGVAHALTNYNISRILIVDFDVHHGNGTEDIFQDESRILSCSLFQYPFYPVLEEILQQPNLINVPIPAHTSGPLYREKFKKYCLDAIQRFKPELVFFSAGFDGHHRDPLASLNLREEDYYLLTQDVKQATQESCQGRFISVLEGGYALEALGPSVIAHLSALLQP